MTEYKYRHSKLKNLGFVILITSIVINGISSFFTNDIEIGLTCISFAILGGVLIMVGLLNEM